MLHLQVSDQTIHMIADPNTFQLLHYTFASQYVADTVGERLLENARNDLENFLASSKGLSELAQVRGHLFQSYVRHVLPLGGHYEARDLQSGELSCNYQRTLNFCMLVRGDASCSHVPVRGHESPSCLCCGTHFKKPYMKGCGSMWQHVNECRQD